MLLPLILLTAMPAGHGPLAGITEQPVLVTEFDLEHAALPPAPVAPPAAEPTGNPFAVSLIEDDRQRLRFGIGPGGRARFGVGYRLSLGERR